MDEQYRLDLIREIEAKRGSKLVCYITSDRLGLPAPIWWADVRVIERHVAALAAQKQTKKLDFLIYTPGGDALAPWSLVSMIREYMGSRPFSVLIPSMAMSAGTMISIGADEIVMGPGAHIGPIDIQVGPGISVEDIHGYFDLAEQVGLKSNEGRANVFMNLAKALHPVMLGALQRVRNEGERTALLLLASRRKALSDANNRKIAHHLLREVGIHGQTIRRSEAKSIGMNFITDAEEAGVLAPMSALFDLYEDLLRLDVPFVGQGRSFGDDEDPFHPTGPHDVIEEPVAVVESLDRLDIARYAFGYRFWKDAPGAHHPARTKETARLMPGFYDPAKRPPAGFAEALEAGDGVAASAEPASQVTVNWETVRRS